jgi:hypothetical protein
MHMRDDARARANVGMYVSRCVPRVVRLCVSLCSCLRLCPRACVLVFVGVGVRSEHSESGSDDCFRPPTVHEQEAVTVLQRSSTYTSC